MYWHNWKTMQNNTNKKWVLKDNCHNNTKVAYAVRTCRQYRMNMQLKNKICPYIHCPIHISNVSSSPNVAWISTAYSMVNLHEKWCRFYLFVVLETSLSIENATKNPASYTLFYIISCSYLSNSQKPRTSLRLCSGNQVISAEVLSVSGNAPWLPELSVTLVITDLLPKNHKATRCTYLFILKGSTWY